MTLSTLSGRVIVPLEVAYGSDLTRTREIRHRAAEMHGEVLSSPKPEALFIGLGESSLDFELRCFPRDVGQILGGRSDLLLDLCDLLGKAGIEIPFPQRDVHIRDKTGAEAGSPPGAQGET